MGKGFNIRRTRIGGRKMKSPTPSQIQEIKHKWEEDAMINKGLYFQELIKLAWQKAIESIYPTNIEWITIGTSEYTFKIPKSYNHDLMKEMEIALKYERQKAQDEVLDDVDTMVTNYIIPDKDYVIENGMLEETYVTINRKFRHLRNRLIELRKRKEKP
jgi:hypothetical protein